MGNEAFVIYSTGLVHSSVCSSLTQEEVERRMSREFTGITSHWRLSPDNFSTGESNPCPCNENPKTHNHYLFSC